MYLSKLEILGFKSFQQKTAVKFNSGITSIVGPNGCGKTNIVDAIRWCLGEQRSSALRSDKMENVIFNGTASKKPMGMAEVSLTIENTKGILPTEFSEVTITRRIFRSGESEYLLNKNICRLKDITNLFMDTGIGANAYSVIELKMVETILSNKAEERRVMFEEAAGVNKYKLRRRLALKKLDDVKADLTRVNDIVSEVEKKVNSLERQAKRADKYNKLSSTLRELELDLADRELALFNLQKNKNKVFKEESFQKKLQLDSQLSEIGDTLSNIKKQLSSIEDKLRDKRNVISLQTEKIYNTQQSISVYQERKKSYELNVERYLQDIDELKLQMEKTKNLIAESQSKINETTQFITAREEEKNSLAKNVDSLRATLDDKRNELNSHNELSLNLFKEITSLENELSNLEKSIQSKNYQINRLNEKIQALTSTIAKTVGFIEKLSEEKSETEKKLSEAEALYVQKQKEKEELEKELNRLKEEELKHKTILNSLKEKINFIQNLIDNLEGVSKGAKALLENNGWAKGNKYLLAHIGNTFDEHRFAIEATLKNNLNNILLETVEDLKNAIEYLKNNDIGKAAFYVTEFDQNGSRSILQNLIGFIFKRSAKKIESAEGFIGWADKLIQADPKWNPFFSKLLKTTAVIKDLETAFLLYKKFPGFNFATLNGDFLNMQGIVEAGSAAKIDDSLLGRKQLLEKLKDEFPQKEIQLGQVRKQIEKWETMLNSIDLKVLSERGRLLVNDLANLDKQISQFEFEKKKAADEIEKARIEIQDLAKESNALDNEYGKLKAQLELLSRKKTNAEELKNTLTSGLKKLETDFSSLLTKQNELNLEIERQIGEKKNLQNSIERAEESIQNIQNSITKREEDLHRTGEEITLIKKEIELLTAALNELEKTRTELTNDENEIDREYQLVKKQIIEKEAQQNRIRNEREEISEELHKSDIKLNEIEIKISNLLENIKENYSVDLKLKEFDDIEAFDFNARIDEVHSLKQQVRNLGPINLLAYSEFEEERTRLEFLQKQRDDLNESEKDLVKTIGEINNTAQALFLETFENIRENFIKIFRGLFNPGDEADLKLEESADPLEAKIEIIAKPKGKRPTSIELLSGGEKTLTAIALLFAIYLVKPSPFCILDEIDAPLDDANIDRFTKILKDFSVSTQFIVVTHNKRTMESADTLYGVTMQDEGVSKLVGVRFNEDFDFVS